MGKGGYEPLHILYIFKSEDPENMKNLNSLKDALGKKILQALV